MFVVTLRCTVRSGGCENNMDFYQEPGGYRRVMHPQDTMDIVCVFMNYSMLPELRTHSSFKLVRCRQLVSFSYLG